MSVFCLFRRAFVQGDSPTPWGGQQPGGGVSKGEGPAGPSLLAIRGCGGEIGTPPRFLEGFGEVSFSKRHLPKELMPSQMAHIAEYPAKGTKKQAAGWQPVTLYYIVCERT